MYFQKCPTLSPIAPCLHFSGSINRELSKKRNPGTNPREMWFPGKTPRLKEMKRAFGDLVRATVTKATGAPYHEQGSEKWGRIFRTKPNLMDSLSQNNV